MRRHETTSSMRVSFIAGAMFPDDANALTAVLMQLLVEPICPPDIANGMVMPPPSVVSHRTAKIPTTILSPSKMARRRRKSNNDVDGIATMKHTPTTACNAWHDVTEATEMISATKFLKPAYTPTLNDRIGDNKGQRHDPKLVIRLVHHCGCL